MREIDSAGGRKGRPYAVFAARVAPAQRLLRAGLAPAS
jgi:hypothetical protein